MAQILSDTGNIAGGTSGALQYGFNDSVTNASLRRQRPRWCSRPTSSRRHRLLHEGEAEHRFNAFTFPGRSSPWEQAASRSQATFVTFRDTRRSGTFVNFLATAPAAEGVGEAGWLPGGNHNVSSTSTGRDHQGDRRSDPDRQRQSVFRHVRREPPSFGGTSAQGEWGLFQDFLKNRKT